ncbi:sensor histidine kinase [Pseudodesulfovibrio sediminis]|uniref:sensor histidine kinase n=1 Tax=Pseudodesulfovibrio sediminis TaxID=2810563 RepID=UPI001E458793|nr:HAMP domain-containing sensor histidine kinase [Pseudodesulfovibrio sediminis]
MKIHRYHFELFTYISLSVLGVILLISLDAYEGFYDFSRDHEELELDEIVLFIPVGLLCFALFSLLRVRELRQKNARLRTMHVEIDQANRKLQELTESREQFMLIACHELKSPLSGVVNALHLIDLAQNSEEREEGLEYAKEAARSLTVLIDDVLKFAQISHSGESRDEPFSLVEIMQTIKQIVKAEVSAKGLEYSIEIDPKTPATVIGSAYSIRLVILNLMGNAIKYTDAGSVAIRSTYHKTPQEELIISVTDTGVGISASDQITIFEPYKRAGNAPDGLKGGLGLGLAIVHQLVEQLGGSIAVSSVEGQGSEFTVRIPVHSI